MANLTGEFITAATANSEINKFLEIRDESYGHIADKLQSEGVSPETLNYYGEMEISFIFDRGLIEGLFKEITDAGVPCNALRVYYAADPAKNGSTTIVLVGANYVKDLSGHVTSVANVFSPDPSHAAIEYPGGGLRNVVPPTPQVDISNDNLTALEITMLP